MSNKGYKIAPIDLHTDIPEWCNQLAQTVNGAMSGRTNNTDSVTLTANAASTTVSLSKGRLAEGSVILFEPTTANAAAEIYGGTMYVSGRDVRGANFTITHANNAQSDRTFKYAIIG